MYTPRCDFDILYHQVSAMISGLSMPLSDLVSTVFASVSYQFLGLDTYCIAKPPNDTGKIWIEYPMIGANQSAKENIRLIRGNFLFVLKL